MMEKPTKPPYRLGKIATASFRALDDAKTDTPPQEEELTTKVTIEANYKLLDLIRRYARAKGMGQGEAVVAALNSFFEENKPPARPKEVVQREQMKIRQDKRRRLRQL